MTYQESDPILDALKSTSTFEVAHFFFLYDLHVTEQQKMKFLSLASTSGKCFIFQFIYINYHFFIDGWDFRFPIGINLLKRLVSVMYHCESLQKGMNVKETELSRERELVKTYKQRSLGMIQELHSKEMEIKKIHSRNVESHPELFGAFLCTCALLRILITLYLN